MPKQTDPRDIPAMRPVRLGPALRRERDRLGLTLSDVAIVAHVPRARLKLWEDGGDVPRLAEVGAVAVALRVSPLVFFR